MSLNAVRFHMITWLLMLTSDMSSSTQHKCSILRQPSDYQLTRITMMQNCKKHRTFPDHTTTLIPDVGDWHSPGWHWNPSSFACTSSRIQSHERPPTVAETWMECKSEHELNHSCFSEPQGHRHSPGHDQLTGGPSHAADQNFQVSFANPGHDDV